MHEPRCHALLAVAVCLAGQVLAAGRPAGAETAPMTEGATVPAAAATPVPRWLVLGPASDPLPVFHDEKTGSYGLEELLKSERFPRERRRPAEGAEETWFGGAKLRWTVRDAAPGGALDLVPPGGAGPGRPATAWLAAYLTAERFRVLDLDLPGAHPRRAWLDGEPVAAGGTGGDKPAEVKGKVKLTTGKHLLLVETVYDPARGAPWQAGAVLREPKETGSPTVGTTLDPAKTLDILDVLDAPQITALAVSPDGIEVAATLSRVVPGTDDSESWIELRSTADGTLLRDWRGGPAFSRIEFDPSGRWLSYVTSEKGTGDAAERSTLWIVDRKTQEARPLVERVEGISEYIWAPDGRSIAFAATVKPEPDKRGVKRLEGLLDRQRDYRSKSYLHLVTVPDGTRRRLTAGALSATGAAFAPDGSRLLFIREVEDFAARPYSRKEIWEIDLTTFDARKLRDGRWIDTAQYSPDGKRLLILAGPSEFGSAGVKVPEGAIPNEGDEKLYVWDPALSQAEPITRDFDPAVTSAFWSRHDGRIYLEAEDRDRVRLYRYDPAARSFEALDAGCDVVQEVAFADDAPVVVATGTSPWTPEALFFAGVGGAPSRTLSRPAASRLEGVLEGKVEPWSFTAKSGRTIDGRVYLPPGFDAAREPKYPAIVYYYGGTSPVERDFGGRYPKEWWASQGYVVYVLEPSGATGFGQAFSALHVNDWGEITSDEIIDGTRKFLESHPYVDAKRIGCIGASFGGFMTELLVTKTDLFAAAVSHAGISSISSYWGDGYWGYSYSAQATAGSFPWNRKDIYVDRSPLFRADRVKTPILLTHGTADTNVPTGESDAFYTALKLLGTPAEYVQIEGMDHLIVDHAKRLVWSRAIVAWFDRWLKGQPEWWDDLFPTRK